MQPDLQPPASEFTKDTDRFLRSVDLPDVIPPPNWTGFTIKNLQSRKEGYISLSSALSVQFRLDVKQTPDGDLCVSGFEHGILDKNNALRFLRHLKKQQPQIEIVFTVGPKSPGLIGLAREGIKAVLKAVHPLES